MHGDQRTTYRDGTQVIRKAGNFTYKGISLAQWHFYEKQHYIFKQTDFEADFW